MNNHLPFQNWIFEEEPLPSDSQRELEQHLQQCAECRALAEGWTAARQSLEGAREMAPRAGFSARWRALAAQRLQTPSPRQAWALLAASSLGSLALATALAVQTSSRGFSMAGVFTREVSAAAGTVEKWVVATNAVGGFLGILSRSIPPACYLLAVFFLSFLGVVWLLMFVRSHARGTKK